VTSCAAHQLNATAPLPHASTMSDYLKSSYESRRADISDMFTGVSRELASVLSSAPARDRTSKVARITELSQTIQSRLRGPMQELERHLECEHASFYYFCVKQSTDLSCMPVL